ncbi:class I SAM-dependent methyltransferase [Candidatus Sumerlaeota bacterium]|nr:class I SAM-dependent methyltransferase [Candidatus Sumerlaeota bacterium]
MTPTSTPPPRSDWEAEYLEVQLAAGYAAGVGKRFDSVAIDVAGREALDIGCGPGVFVDHLVERGARRVVGVDVSAFYLSRIRERHPEAQCLVASAHSLPLADETFDVVLLLDTLLHLDARRALDEARRVLRPGGFLWVSHKLAGYYWWNIRHRTGRSPGRFVVETLSSVKRLLEPKLRLSRRSTYTNPEAFERMLEPLQVEHQNIIFSHGVACQIEVLARKPS